MTELVDVVDLDDRVIGTVTRAVMRRDRLRHRAVFIAVRSSTGRLLVHRRSELKDVWPGWWDIAVGGVVAAGEGYDDAAARELREEVGVEAAPTRLDTAPAAYADDHVALLGRCYTVTADGPFDFHDGEVAEARWVDVAGLAELRRVERFLPDSLELLAPLLDGIFRGEQPGVPSGGTPRERSTP